MPMTEQQLKQESEVRARAVSRKVDAMVGLPLGLSREEAIESLWETVRQAENDQRRIDPGFVRWPDLDALIEHIDAHGFPPPND